MPQRTSLLAGRRTAPLTPEESRRASQIFLGFEYHVSCRYEEGVKTEFFVRVNDEGEHVGEIVFGPDIYPGGNIADANSSLSIAAAAAHELTQFHRWRDSIAISEDALGHLDEALTSLQAIQRYGNDPRLLNPTEVRQ